jgi:ankyrin repeat protein
MARRVVFKLLGGFAALVLLGLAAAAGLVALAGWRSVPRDPLTRAALAGDAGSLRTLLGAAGPLPGNERVNAFGAGGFTPLDWAARAGRVDAIRILLAAGGEALR